MLLIVDRRAETRTKEEPMKYVFLTLAILFSIIGVATAIVVVYHNDRDLDSVMNRAQVAAEAVDMVEYMTTYKTNLERMNRTSGHTALVFKTPGNDLALHYRAVTRIIARLESIKDLPKTETTYQVALDDIRGTIRELEFVGGGITWITLHWMLWVALGLWLITGIANFFDFK